MHQDRRRSAFGQRPCSKESSARSASIRDDNCQPMTRRE
jgi:hypothetical protein